MDFYGLGAFLRALSGVSGPEIAIRVMLLLGAIGIVIKAIRAIWDLLSEFVRSIMAERTRLLDQNEKAWAEIKAMADKSGEKSEKLAEVLTQISEREAAQVNAFEALQDSFKQIKTSFEAHEKEARIRAREFHKEVSEYHRDVLKLRGGGGG